MKYEIGRVYILESKNTDNVYIGSTGMKYLSQRIALHRQKYKLYLKMKWFHYYTSFDILKKGDVTIRELEKHYNIEKSKLEEIESDWIKNTPNCVNKLLAGKGMTKEDKKERSKEKILCKCGETIRKSHIRRHEKSEKHLLNIDSNYRKQKNEEYDEQIKKSKIIEKERKKEYVKNHKDIINENAKKKKECPCGSLFRAKDRLRHEKSLKHANWIKSCVNESKK